MLQKTMTADQLVETTTYESFEDAMNQRIERLSEIQHYVVCVAQEAINTPRLKESDYLISIHIIDPILQRCFDKKVSPWDAANMVFGRAS
jgi:hypothetical protein